jgi:hypothetical protein
MKCGISYTGIAIVIGSVIGTAVGAALGHIGAWIAIGAGMGLLIPALTGKGFSDCARPSHPLEDVKLNSR